MKTSIVIPFWNEEDNVAAVLKETVRTNPGVEVIGIDDGSTDKTALLIQTHGSPVRYVPLPEHRGKSAAVHAGLRAAEGDLLVIMDGDGQDDPAEIPRMLATLKETGAGVVISYRKNRKDHFFKKILSRTANRLRQAILGDSSRDTCSIKVIRREHIGLLVPFEGMHRFIPSFLHRAGISMVEVAVNHRPRLTGKSKYGTIERVRRGIIDVFVVWHITNRNNTDLKKLS